MKEDSATKIIKEWSIDVAEKLNRTLRLHFCDPSFGRRRQKFIIVTFALGIAPLHSPHR
jgi:hypothetical protein